MKISVILMICILGIYVVSRPAYKIRWPGKEINGKTIFLILSCTLLFCVAAFRGDFATDYPIYHWQFNYYKNMPVSGISSVRDIGFFLWSKIIFLFTDSILVAFISMAFVMMLMYYIVIKEDSCNYLLSLLLLVGIDNYIVSFNLMRYILVVSIYMYLMRYIARKDLKKYAVGVLFLTLLHRAAIVMLPFYWLLGIDYRKKQNFLMLLSGIVCFTVFFFFTKPIAVFIQAVIGMDYGDSGLDYGSIGSALKSGVLLLFLLYFWKRIDHSDRKERMWVNGCFFATMFHILAMKVLMMHRAAYMVSGSFILLIPLVISRLPLQKRRIVSTGLIVSVLLYCQFLQIVQDYYPFWKNTMIMYR
ncbi:MAG: EpsG family protein [Lachnospiraceae bacterium]|nr:EpsG family protein [Lachnospiraceae bacterium]